MENLKKQMKNYKNQVSNDLLNEKNIEYIDLNDMQEADVLNSILNMPEDEQNILIFKNYYNHSFEEIGDIFDIENAKGEYLFLVVFLSELINTDGKIISDSSMIKVCNKVAKIINDEINLDYEKFKKHEKKLHYRKMFTKKIASYIILFVVVSFILVLADTYAEGKIFDWVVNTFKEYSSFSTNNNEEVSKNNINKKIGYIPKGFTLDNTVLKNNMDIYYYKKDKKFLVINFVYDDKKSFLNTENAIIEEFDLDGLNVTYWEKENVKYFLFVKNEIGCQIYGHISKEEGIDILENITLEKNNLIQK